MQHRIRYALCTFFMVTLLSGCIVHVGPTGLDVAIAGTFYSHSETNAGAGGTDDSEDVNGEEDSSSGPFTWRTHAARTWGTSGVEGEITTESEKISIQGKGMSDNLQETLGDDIIRDIANAARKATPAGGAAAIGEAIFSDDEPPPGSEPAP